MKKLLAVILAALVLAGLFGVQTAYAKPGNHNRQIACPTEVDCD